MALLHDVRIAVGDVYAAKKLQELTPAPKAEASETAATPAAPAAAPVQNVSTPVEAGPGMQLTGDLKACVVGDTTPPGTVRDGYRKVVTQTPFGASCRWELVK